MIKIHLEKRGAETARERKPTLTIGVQSFQFGYSTGKREEAFFMMNMMAKALRKITKKRVKVDKTWTKK